MRNNRTCCWIKPDGKRCGETTGTLVDSICLSHRKEYDADREVRRKIGQTQQYYPKKGPHVVQQEKRIVAHMKRVTPRNAAFELMVVKRSTDFAKWNKGSADKLNNALIHLFAEQQSTADVILALRYLKEIGQDVASRNGYIINRSIERLGEII